MPFHPKVLTYYCSSLRCSILRGDGSSGGAAAAEHRRALLSGGGPFVEVPAEMRVGWAPFNGPNGQVGHEASWLVQLL